jgi:hypothetical protein
VDIFELAAFVGSICDAEGIPYFVTGSVASSFYGRGRSTEDVDIAVALDGGHVEALCRHFEGERWYVSLEAARDAARRRGMFNVIDTRSAYKIDFICLPDTPYAREQLSRARKLRSPDGQEVMAASAEDVVLNKLLFFREGQSDKHMKDIGRIIETSGAELDLKYLHGWAARLGVAEELALALKKAV